MELKFNLFTVWYMIDNALYMFMNEQLVCDDVWFVLFKTPIFLFKRDLNQWMCDVGLVKEISRNKSKKKLHSDIRLTLYPS